jgi:hypothetical protein
MEIPLSGALESLTLAAPEWTSLNGTSLISSTHSRAMIKAVKVRPGDLGPLLEVRDEAGKDRLLSLQSLKSGLWAAISVPDERADQLRQALMDCRQRSLREERARTEERSAKEQREREQRAAEIALQTAEAVARHKKRLEKLSVPYFGVRQSMRARRVTFCWSCKFGLDNDIDVECATCGWILCRCGACGCGRVVTT